MVLEFEVEAIAEDVLVILCLAPGPREIAGNDPLGDLGGETTRQADDALGVLLDKVPVGAGLIVEPF